MPVLAGFSRMSNMSSLSAHEVSVQVPQQQGAHAAQEQPPSGQAAAAVASSSGSRMAGGAAGGSTARASAPAKAKGGGAAGQGCFTAEGKFVGCKNDDRGEAGCCVIT